MQTSLHAPARSSKALFRWWPVVLAVLPVLYYGVTVVRYAYNFPYMDDYPTVVEFLTKLPTATGGWEKLNLLLAQNNFHRVVWVKGVAWLSIVLSGQVNFTFLQYLGNASLLLTAYLLFRLTRSGQATSTVIFLPACYLLFQFQSWNNTFWSMAAMSNLWAPAWALLAFYLASRRQEAWAIGISLIAMFTNGNGILVLPLLALGYGLSGRLRWALGTLLIGIPAFVFYFSGYQNPAGAPLAQLFQPTVFWHLLQLDTAFLGALFYHPAVSWLSGLVGLATMGWTFYLLLIRYDRQNPALFWMLIFLQLTGLMLATNRISNGVEVMFASRYRNVSALLLATAYLTAAEQVSLKRLSANRWLYRLALVGTIGFNIVSNYTYHSKIARFRELKQSDQFLWQQFGLIHGSSPIYDAAEQLTQLTQQRWFAPTPLTATALRSREVTLPELPAPTDTAIVYHIDLLQQKAGHTVITGFAKIKNQQANFNDTYVGVGTPTGWRFFSTLFHQRLDNVDAMNDKDTGFTALLAPSALPDSTAYRLGIFVQSGGKRAFTILPYEYNRHYNRPGRQQTDSAQEHPAFSGKTHYSVQH